MYLMHCVLFLGVLSCVITRRVLMAVALWLWTWKIGTHPGAHFRLPAQKVQLKATAYTKLRGGQILPHSVPAKNWADACLVASSKQGSEVEFCGRLPSTTDGVIYSQCSI